MNNGIKSKDRVKDFGEVFTPDKTVSDMLNMRDEQFGSLPAEEYILKTFLEPACGDGQFLVRILYRKLLKVAELPVEEQQLWLVKALSSIYGVDILDDNVMWARRRMKYIIFGDKPHHTFTLDGKTEPIYINLGIEKTSELESVVNSILKRNILCGNTLEAKNLVLTAYKFNGNTVEMVDGYLDGEDTYFPGVNYIHYMDIPKVEVYADDEVGDDAIDISGVPEKYKEYIKSENDSTSGVNSVKNNTSSKSKVAGMVAEI